MLSDTDESKIENLQEEKTADQNEVIELQKDLIGKNDGKIGHVSKTDEDGFETYSSVLQQSCTTALSPKKLLLQLKRLPKEMTEARKC